MTTRQFSVIDLLSNRYCIGCGVCAGVCPSLSLRMTVSDEGCPKPELCNDACKDCGLCGDVCPFFSGAVNEDQIASERFSTQDGIAHSSSLGYYLQCYVGAVRDDAQRRLSASGGLATWLLFALLRTGYVDAIIRLVPSTDEDDSLFSFAICRTEEEVRQHLGSVYYPADIGTVLRHISTTECYALIGLPCLLKGIRLAARRVPSLEKSIRIMVGLVCGSMKSRQFTDYMISRAMVARKDVERVSFREKIPGHDVGDYFFRAHLRSGRNSQPCSSRSAYGRTFSSPEFGLFACDYCDDIFAEVADVCFMDAWLPQYMTEERGTSLVVARSSVCRKLIEGGIASSELSVEPIMQQQVEASQLAQIHAKRETLSHRLWICQRRSISYPPKRVVPKRPALTEMLRLMACDRLRMASYQAWKQSKEDSLPSLASYDRAIASARKQLARVNSIREYMLFAQVAVRKVTKLIVRSD